MMYFKQLHVRQKSTCPLFFSVTTTLSRENLKLLIYSCYPAATDTNLFSAKLKISNKIKTGECDSPLWTLKFS